MQIVSSGDNLHEMSKSIFWEKIRKIFQMSSAEIFTQLAKHDCHSQDATADNVLKYFFIVPQKIRFVCFIWPIFFCICATPEKKRFLDIILTVKI